MEQGICPVCEGTGQTPLSEKDRAWGWNKDLTHKDCRNCGGQTMWGKPTGLVNLREDGTPCVHEYTGRNAGHCYTIYDCRHCSFSFGIDSGD